MSYIAVIKEAVHTVHKNWQLVVIQFAAMLLSCISFFAIVGIPIAVAFVMFGLDFTEILRFTDVISAFKGSAEFLGKYFGMALVVILSLIIYIAFIVLLWIFTVSGAIGILSKSMMDEGHRFTVKSFFAEGRRLFFPVLLFSSLVSIIFVTLAFILGILGGTASAVIEMAKTQEVTLALFLGVFFSLVLISAGLFLIMVTLSITVYGIAFTAFDGLKPFNALKETVKYLYSTPSSIAFYVILLIGYTLAGFIVVLIGTPLTLIPIIGPILSLPYQIVTYAVQGYVSLIMLSSVFHFYYKTRQVSPPLQSSLDSDASPNIEGGQPPLPVETDPTRQE
ncbi:MAG: hypothetical protein A2077_04810 [Nitrospirae bacterium GWC2_46_6]|nr:MAG: hypothetical protein A2077_04810 [Nitrospirae bacterium GWC2_46_6]OGW21084.1 MAG: hypothetical protein A2Z82_07720 [Nitrospirae bacterium GWA2_46_11]OGW26001.1 MAG: hypothetical protein A2X55_06700 [Nitrospirae bacterium GWB2_47_37]